MAPTRHGTRTTYNAGCRCDKCSQAENEYAKSRRNGATVTSIGPDAEKPMGDNEAGVRAQVANLSTAESRPALVAMAITLAKSLDNPLNVSQWNANSKNLRETLAELQRGADARVSKLSSVRSMSRPARVAG